MLSVIAHNAGQIVCVPGHLMGSSWRGTFDMDNYTNMIEGW